MTRITETVRVSQKTTVGMTCDICGRESRDRDEFDQWQQAVTYHHDWGNDSHESREEYDVCSAVCYLAVLRQSVSDPSLKRSGEVDDLPIWLVRDLVALIPEATP